MLQFSQREGMDMSIGRRIQEIRTSQNKSLRGVASEIDVSVAYLSNIEKGESSPTIEVLKKLASTFNLTVRELTEAIEEDSDMELPKSLQQFIEEYSEKFKELTDRDWQRTLASVRLRGRYPETAEDWLPIFASMRNALKEDT